MAGFMGGGSGGPDYVQPDEPSGPDPLETWYDTDADPDGDGTAQGQYKIYGTDGAWHATSVESHRSLRDVLADSHHQYPIPTDGIADGAVNASKHLNGVDLPQYSDLANMNLSEGQIAYNQADNSLYLEDGA